MVNLFISQLLVMLFSRSFVKVCIRIPLSKFLLTLSSLICLSHRRNSRVASFSPHSLSGRNRWMLLISSFNTIDISCCVGGVGEQGGILMMIGSWRWFELWLIIEESSSHSFATSKGITFYLRLSSINNGMMILLLITLQHYLIFMSQATDFQILMLSTFIDCSLICLFFLHDFQRNQGSWSLLFIQLLTILRRWVLRKLQIPSRSLVFLAFHNLSIDRCLLHLSQIPRLSVERLILSGCIRGHQGSADVCLLFVILMSGCKIWQLWIH